MEDTEVPEPLLDRTYELLDSRGRLSLREICEQSGIDESWLAKFHRKTIPNPGVKLVQRLHDFLLTRAKAA